MAQQQQITGWKQSIGKAKQRFQNIAKMSNTGMVWERESMFALQAIKSSKYLQECNTDSIRDAIINVASIGLSLSPAEKLVYIVPRDGKAVLDVSYQGLLKLATDSGSVMWAKVELVYEQDEFEWLGVNKMPHHRIADPFTTHRGPLRGGYCVAQLASGDKLIEVMGKDELDKVKDQSKAKNGPWKTWPEEMMKKTILKRAYKSWPKSQRMSEAVDILNRHEGIDFDTRPAEQVSEPAVLLVNDEQVGILNKLVEESHVNVNKIFAAFDIDSLENLPQEQFEECKARLVSAKGAYEKKQAEKQRAEQPEQEGAASGEADAEPEPAGE